MALEISRLWQKNFHARSADLFGLILNNGQPRRLRHGRSTMKTAGPILSVLCLLAAILILVLGYVVTFGEPHLIGLSESTPKEGWDYWIQKEFWKDVRSFSLYAVLALGGFLFPLLASICGARSAQVNRLLSWILFSLSTLYASAWAWGLVLSGRGAFFPLILVLMIMLLGSVYAASIFFAQARRRATGSPQ